MLWLLACASPELPVPTDLPVHHLTFGGDTLVGENLNLALADPDVRSAMFVDVADLLRDADLTLLNSEGVISGGGRIADKGESRPHLYRARPAMMGILAAAGVDVLAGANNHSGDYGPDALREHLDLARVAGLDYAGVGHDLADARTPAYRKVGDTVVAIVGADLTDTALFAARADRPGSLALPLARAVEELAPIVAEARKHAHVVVLTPHWGENGKTAPTDALREAGRALIGAGFDAILGHSAHVPQGVELVDGKPVVYDAGNFLAGHAGTGDQASAVLYDVAFTRAGVVSVRAVPVAMKAARVGSGKARDLATWQERTRALGTAVDGDVVTCDPGGVSGPEGAPEPPVRPAPATVREAPRDAIVGALPEGVTPAAVRWENGVSLVGYHLVAKALRVPKAGQVFDLYFRADGPVPADLIVSLEGRGSGVDREDHTPGDWMLPGDEWPPGALVHDRSLMRLLGKPTGTVRFALNLRVGRELLEISSSDLPLDRGVLLGEADYVPGTPRLFELPEMK